MAQSKPQPPQPGHGTRLCLRPHSLTCKMGTAPTSLAGIAQSTEQWSRHERAVKRHGFAVQIQTACGRSSREPSRLLMPITTPRPPDADPALPYSLPQAQTFPIFKGTGQQVRSSSWTQSSGPDPVWSLGQGVT